MIWMWIGFVAMVLFLLALDLGVLNRKAHVIGVKEALGWSAFWISLALLFAVFVYYGYERQWLGLGRAPDGTVAVDPVDNDPLDGRSATTKYLTGYVIEKSLSVDNIFVIAVIFSFFAVPAIYQHRVLFWGILGALIMRGLMIGVGTALINRFHWILYIFGGFLILTALKMLTMKEGHGEIGDNIVVRLTRRFFPITEQYHDEKFFIREAPAAVAGAAPGDARLVLTPLALALVVVETTDLIFAVDSIPAIFAITGDPFLVFTSNVFAILGLRSLYFALAGMVTQFRYLKTALAIILAVVGVKMLIAGQLKAIIGHNFNFWLLGLIFAILSVGVGASIVANRRDKALGTPGPAPGAPPPGPTH